MYDCTWLLLKKLSRGREVLKRFLLPINVCTNSCRKYEIKAVQIIRGDHANSLLNEKKNPIRNRAQTKKWQAYNARFSSYAKKKEFPLITNCNIDKTSLTKYSNTRQSNVLVLRTNTIAHWLHLWWRGSHKYSKRMSLRGQITIQADKEITEQL